MSEGMLSKTENNVEQKHMFSAWEKCVQEVEENKDGPRFKLEFDINGNLLTPNGQISEYNRYRQKDNEEKYVKPENENDDPALLLAKIIRTKVFIEGDRVSEWNGFGDWINNGVGHVCGKTKEPMLVFHGTVADIPTQTGLQPQNPFKKTGNTSPKYIFFAQDIIVSSNYMFSLKQIDKLGQLYTCFVNIRKINDGISAEPVDGDGDIFITRGGSKLFKVFNGRDVFHVGLSVGSLHPLISRKYKSNI